MSAEPFDPAVTRLDPLTHEDCLSKLREHVVGRVAVVIDGHPTVVPVNYRLAETAGRTWIVLRTRPGNIIDLGDVAAAFEIDEVDPQRRTGWSVLVRGTMHRVDPAAADFAARFDPEPWVGGSRDAWLVIEPFTITGRVLHGPEIEWAFDPEGYL